MSTKKRILVTLIVAVLAAIVISRCYPSNTATASSRSSPTRCTTWAWVTGRTRAPRYRIPTQVEAPKREPPTHVTVSPQYANPFGCSASTANPGLTTSNPLAL